jgi:hypothetical protein
MTIWAHKQLLVNIYGTLDYGPADHQTLVFQVIGTFHAEFCEYYLVIGVPCLGCYILLDLYGI